MVDPLQEKAYETFKKASSEWNNGEKVGPAPTLDKLPTTHATKEGLAALLRASPGIAFVRDELVAWVRSFDAYRQGGVRQDWLSLWAGVPLKIDRKTQKTVYVQRPCVVVVGGVQPDLIPDLATQAARLDGFFDRLDLAWPHAKTLRWSEASIEPKVEERAVRHFGRLRPQKPVGSVHATRCSPSTLRPARCSEHG